MRNNRRGDMSPGIIAAIAILSLLGLFALSWVLNSFGILSLSFFGKARANVERDIYEQSHSYKQGMIQQFRKGMAEYERTPKDDKLGRAGLRSIMLQQAGDIGNENDLPDDIRAFLYRLRNSG